MWESHVTSVHYGFGFARIYNIIFNFIKSPVWGIFSGRVVSGGKNFYYIVFQRQVRHALNVYILIVILSLTTNHLH